MRRISNGTTSISVEGIVRPRGRRTRIGLRSISAVLIVGVSLANRVQAQTNETPTQAGTPAPANSSGSDPLTKYVTNDRLVFLVESHGLNEYADAWQKTNAFKLLTGTPLGSMLELVGAQFIDQMFTKIAARKISGSEVVALIKHVARNGWILAINSVDKGPKPYRITLVLKGASSKSLRPVTSRFLGLAMGDIRPRLVHKENRTIIAVDVPAVTVAPPTGAPAAKDTAKAAAPGALPAAAAPPIVKSPPLTWIWWPEQDDLVIGIFPNDDGALMLSTIDGKVPSAISNPQIAAKKAEDNFQPISARFMDLSAVGGFAGQDWLMSLLREVKDLTGAKGIVQRVGLDDDALVTKTWLTSPRPFTSASSLFDVPPFKKSDLIPMPEGVHSFATFSIKAEKLPGLIDHLDPTGELRTKLDEFRLSLKDKGRVDLENDLLARLGPKMTFYLSPLRSAAADDESLSLQSLFARGINLPSLIAVARPFIPEATFVAEIKDPSAFIKALDGFIIALNHEIKVKATEIEKEAEAEKEAGRGRGDDIEPGGRRGGAGADRTKARKKPEVQTPKFNLIASPTNTRKFQLSTPTASKLRLGPPHFRPVIYVDGKYLVVSASASTAEVAINALVQKDWKPAADVEKALADVPNDVVSLAIFDPGQTTPSMLSGFPGMVQAQINAGIALSKVQVAGIAGSPNTTPAGPGPNMLRRRDEPQPRSAKDADDEFIDFRARRGDFAGAQANAAAKPTVPPQTIQLQVEPEQLPKAEEIKALLFPTTVYITSDKDGLLISQRSAFPEQIGIESNAVIIGFMMPTIQAALVRFRSSAAPANPQPNTMGNNPLGGQASPGAAGGARTGRRRRDDF